MKTLYLVRHAKSSWENSYLSDHDRPLNHRGKRDAPLMGKRLRQRTPHPEIIISSSALRAQTTATYLAEEMGFPTANIVTEERIYGAGLDEILSLIHRLDNRIGCAMLIGHNPTFTELVNLLGHCHIDHLPTCGVAILVFPVDEWDKIQPGMGNVVEFDYPKKG